MTKPEDEKNEGEEKTEAQQIIMLGGSDTEIRTVALYGDVTEELAKEVISGIWYLKATAQDRRTHRHRRSRDRVPGCYSSYGDGCFYEWRQRR